MAPTQPNPLSIFLERGPMVLDAGLATALESAGCTLDDELWSARILLESPEHIERAHHEFLRAGADCITTSSYQATPQRFREHGLTTEETRDLFARSVQIACDARERFLQGDAGLGARPAPLVAASIGPYGAFLADGSEYTGDYDLSVADLVEFHRERWDVLAGTAADLLACETIPSLAETEALLRLLQETPGRWAWMSFSCSDETHLCDGNPLVQALDRCAGVSNLAAVGINCTPPDRISALIRLVRGRVDLPIVVYPNSGERYSAEFRSWQQTSGDFDWATSAAEWLRLGASALGGCCRTGTAEIALFRRLVDAAL